MCEIFKSINGMTPEYLGNLVTVKEIRYESRPVIPLHQTKVRTVLYGHRSFDMREQNCGTFYHIVLNRTAH